MHPKGSNSEKEWRKAESELGVRRPELDQLLVCTVYMTSFYLPK